MFRKQRKLHPDPKKICTFKTALIGFHFVWWNTLQMENQSRNNCLHYWLKEALISYAILQAGNVFSHEK